MFFFYEVARKRSVKMNRRNEMWGDDAVRRCERNKKIWKKDLETKSVGEEKVPEEGSWHVLCKRN